MVTTPASVQAIYNRIQQIESKLKSFGVDPTQTRFEDIFEPLANVQNADKTALLDLIGSAAEENQLDPALAKAVATIESGLNPNAISHTGAQGLMQLMPKTAESLGVSNPLDPAQNALGGTKYLKSLLNQYQQSVPMALAAYNAGPGAVAQHHGIPPYAETQNYVNKVMAQYQSYKQGAQ